MQPQSDLWAVAALHTSRRTGETRLISPLATLLERLEDRAACDADVIPWGAPVPAFGDLASSRVATLGLNPSNREFVDDQGLELSEDLRRFHTLRSLGIESWSQAEAKHLSLILDACRNYFMGNPYDRWFRRLDVVVAATGASFYSAEQPACHLDVIPYATAQKWMALTRRQRARLLDLAGDTLGLLLRHAPVRVLILNGQSVVTLFEKATGVRLERQVMPQWSLPRVSAAPVAGIAYAGVTNSISGHCLAQDILVLGFNHNLQSSFGVTAVAVAAIRAWVAEQAGTFTECVA